MQTGEQRVGRGGRRLSSCIAVDTPRLIAPPDTHRDCGLACVMMVLRALGVDRVTYEDLAAACNTESIWTVDIAHLLARYRVPATFCTTAPEPRPSYATEPFYAPRFEADAARVRALFGGAAVAGVAVEERR